MIDVLKYGRPESQILLKYLVDTFAPSAITPYYYQGQIAGTQFLTYAATKLYFCVSMVVTSALNSNTASISMIYYDQANAAFYYHNCNTYFNATSAAANFYVSQNELKDFYFSRLNYSLTNINISFKGYILTY